MSRIRADLALVEQGQTDSRSKAQALILAGAVYAGNQRVEKPGDLMARDIPLTLRKKDHPWVSRGGLKLLEALKHFNLQMKGITAIDVGASTGGFTDVLLTHGAKKVYAVDVGRGQLAWKLRTDDRVVVLEETNARNLTDEQIPEPVEAVVCDASFIGLEKILPAPMALTKPNAWLVALIKPQFQVGRGQVGKGGVVRDPALHQKVCTEVCNWLNARPDWRVEGVMESPVIGPKGNVEFLVCAHRQSAP